MSDTTFLEPIEWTTHPDPGWEATYYLQDGSWRAEARCLRQEHTWANAEGSTLDACREDLAEVLALFVEDGIPTTHVARLVLVDAPEVHAEVAHAVSQRDVVERLEVLAAASTSKAVEAAADAGLRAPDLATMLGITRSRIYQIRRDPPSSLGDAVVEHMRETMSPDEIDAVNETALEAMNGAIEPVLRGLREAIAAVDALPPSAHHGMTDARKPKVA